MTTRAKTLTTHEKINIRSYYTRERNKAPYTMTFGFLEIWKWNKQQYYA
jgi:hypothetical protein